MSSAKIALDNIYWINLDRRPDRKKHMEDILINNNRYTVKEFQLR